MFVRWHPAQWPAIDNSAIKRLAKGKLPSHPLCLIGVQTVASTEIAASF